MKILDVPQAGKCGVIVGQGGRYGQVRRALAIPTNPRSTPQMLQRNYLSMVAPSWRGLTQEKRDAWTAAAKAFNSKPSVGQKGTLTGCQLFCKVNVANLTIGNATVDQPPVRPDFGLLPVDRLLITNLSNTLALKLHTTDAPADGTMLRAGAPVSQGRDRAPEMAYLGTLASPGQAGLIPLTTRSTAQYGVPTVGSKVFVTVNQNVNGYEDIPHTFWAIVPTSS
jgi:hypothetical protein